MSREAAKASVRQSLMDSSAWKKRFRRMSAIAVEATRFGTETSRGPSGDLFSGSLHAASQGRQVGQGEIGRTLKSEWILHCGEDLNIGEDVRDEGVTPNVTYRVLSKLNHEDQAVLSYLLAKKGGAV